MNLKKIFCNAHFLMVFAIILMDFLQDTLFCDYVGKVKRIIENAFASRRLFPASRFGAR